ncbi:MAG: D-aminoacyl-tRNA deacylase [Endomicrobiales bacterium]
MKAVVQRVKNAAVNVRGKEKNSINRGLVVLVGVGENDSEKDVTFLADKLLTLRIFPSEQGKFDRSVTDIRGEFLVVSQFTLYGDCMKGRRPDFAGAARPEKAVPLYEGFVERLASSGLTVKTGVFGADMLVDIQNDGPVTVIIDTEKGRD